MPRANAFKPLSKNDLADNLGVSVRTIENWVNDGTLPAPVKLGNRVYWHPNAFFAWLDRRLSTESESPVDGDNETVPMPIPQPKAEKSKVRKQPVTTKSELEKVRNRTQAQLDALMG